MVSGSTSKSARSRTCEGNTSKTWRMKRNASVGTKKQGDGDDEDEEDVGEALECGGVAPIAPAAPAAAPAPAPADPAAAARVTKAPRLLPLLYCSSGSAARAAGRMERSKP